MTLALDGDSVELPPVLRPQGVPLLLLLTHPVTPSPGRSTTAFPAHDMVVETEETVKSTPCVCVDYI